MCGRAYETYTEDELYFRYLNERAKRHPLGIKPNYNLAPTQSSPVVLMRNGQREISLMRWGLIPAWASDIRATSKYSLINARSEEILQKRTYKAAFLKRRCIVPLSGFYEWKRQGDGPKIPYAISGKDAAILSVAGVWEHWVDKSSGEVVESFAILTVGANSMMQAIHDRMPVILAPSDEAQWLDSEIEEPTLLIPMLKPCPSEWLTAHEVSTAVNSPKNNRRELILAIQPESRVRR